MKHLKRQKRCVYGVIAASPAVIAHAMPAQAHPGGHSHMSFLELLQHLTQPDHLALLALAVGVGLIAYRWGRRIEARAKAAAPTRKEHDRRAP